MLNFQEITDEQMQEAVQKLREHDLGIQMGRYNDGSTATYGQLIDPSLYSTGEITRKMREVGHKIQVNINDPILENQEMMFSHITPKDEVVEITYEDAYLFLRSAFAERKSTVEYKEKRRRLKEAMETVERLKTTSEKRKEAKKLVKELEQEIGA